MPRDICNVAGWGNTRARGFSLPSKLQEVNLKVLEADRCTRYPHFIPNSMLCVGDPREVGKSSFQLAQEARLSDQVQLIPLPRYQDKVKLGSMCSVAGWGQTLAMNKNEVTTPKTKRECVAFGDCNDLPEPQNLEQLLHLQQLCQVHVLDSELDKPALITTLAVYPERAKIEKLPPSFTVYTVKARLLHKA
ncbi:Mast cell protease 3 [Platysternon megacephalum]|uniref:Mast cell protease 3 n=1 Tax=Platysternon megacephalum TaxID=55544 RepID=A0A4D9DPQ5_9SAUR|nr:Mast cell protease 3 [Platysternon megacephalum]